MRKVILLRFGELYLKGKNKGYFEKTLLNNIKHSLRDFDINVEKISGRYLITNFDDMDYESIVGKLTKVFGLTSLSIATEFDTSKENIENFLSNFKTALLASSIKKLINLGFSRFSLIIKLIFSQSVATLLKFSQVAYQSNAFPCVKNFRKITTGPGVPQTCENFSKFNKFDKFGSLRPTANRSSEK